MKLPKRKPNRLKDYDYSTEGAYFITICTQDRKCLLARIVGGGALDAPNNPLTDTGRIIEKHILSGICADKITIDKYVIMPNHVHLLLMVNSRPSSAAAPTNAVVPQFVSTLKRFSHKEIGARIFQRSYHDHIIRNEQDYLRIREYMENNPKQWELDCFYMKED